MIITFCGHSNYSSNLGDEEKLFGLLEEVAKGNQVDFYLGGYGSFDIFAHRCAKKYKGKHPNSKLIFITPYLDKWLKKREENIGAEYDAIVYPELESVPKKFAILRRNEWMVERSDYVIGYVKTHYGGAYKTLLYAHKHKKPYVNLYQGEYELY